MRAVSNEATQAGELLGGAVLKRWSRGALRVALALVAALQVSASACDQKPVATQEPVVAEQSRATPRPPADSRIHSDSSTPGVSGPDFYSFAYRDADSGSHGHRDAYEHLRYSFAYRYADSGSHSHCDAYEHSRANSIGGASTRPPSQSVRPRPMVQEHELAVVVRRQHCLCPRFVPDPR